MRMIIGLICLVIISFNAVFAQSSTKPPNILFILADDLGYGIVFFFNIVFMQTFHHNIDTHIIDNKIMIILYKY